jgi:hypothetical protein
MDDAIGNETTAEEHEETMTDIQCPCGTVRLQLTGEPRAQFFCHCDDCQKVHGAAYIPVAMYPADAVKITSGAPSTWKLRTTGRITCRECGTRVFAEVGQIGVRGVNGFLLPKGSFQPTFHMQCQHAVRPIKDDLTHFKAFPAKFGGSDETVDW